LYLDNGSEGQHSCLKLSSTTHNFAASRVDPCPVGSHLLTLKGSNPLSGLFAFANTLTVDEYWLGAFQSYTATNRNRGWTWVDGTDAANLNCGEVDTLGCNLWSFEVRIIDTLHMIVVLMTVHACCLCYSH
jgi:hypothetical protein